MTNFKNIAIGTVGLLLDPRRRSAGLGAQYYPQQQSGGVVGAIVNAVTGGGYGQYPMGNYGYNQVSQRQLVQQCTIAAEQRLTGYAGQRYGGYNSGGAIKASRAMAIRTRAARASSASPASRAATMAFASRASPLRGAYGQQAYGQRGYGQQRYQNGYNANAQADLAFTGKVNVRGQVTDVNITRNNMGYRGY